MKARLAIYWKPAEREQLQAMVSDLEVSPYRYVKDCVQHLTAFIQAIQREDAPQIWNTFFGIVQAYGNFELNLNSICAALRDSAPLARSTISPLASPPLQKTRKKHSIPLLRPEQQRTVELAGAALGPELKEAFKAFKVLEAAADSEDVPTTPDRVEA